MKNLHKKNPYYVSFSKACEKEIRQKIKLHYPKEARKSVYQQVERKYESFLSEWKRDLGGKRNFHNGKGGTYDCIAFMSYYVVCKPFSSREEIEEMEADVILPSFRKLRFANLNKPFWKKIMHKAFQRAKKQSSPWKDYRMNVFPYEKEKPIQYEFTSCPVAEFALHFHLNDIMSAFCNVDYACMEMIHARLVRTTTCSNGKKCDYAIYGDKDESLRMHPEYISQDGYRRNE